MVTELYKQQTQALYHAYDVQKAEKKAVMERRERRAEKVTLFAKLGAATVGLALFSSTINSCANSDYIQKYMDASKTVQLKVETSCSKRKR